MFFAYQIMGTHDYNMFVFPDNKPVSRALHATNSVYACDFSHMPELDACFRKCLSHDDYMGLVACYFYDGATSRDLTRRMTPDELDATGLLEVRPAQEVLKELQDCEYAPCLNCGYANTNKCFKALDAVAESLISD